MLKLTSEWTLGEPIGDASGFGHVFAASSPEHPRAVAKLVPKDPGASRELLFADDVSGVPNVVPVIDRGDAGDSWALIMPRAEKSLRQHLVESNGRIAADEAVAIMVDVATALDALESRGVIHRDLKPANILLLDGHWCLADFGISKYMADATGPETRKFYWTAPYAAPEQWRTETATPATDIYALGVVAYEMLAGVTPFVAQSWEEYRELHLHEAVPALVNVPTVLAAPVEQCLSKSPAARPTAANLLARLPGSASPAPLAGLAKLEVVNREEIARQGELARAASVQQSEADRRSQLVSDARRGLARTIGLLRQIVLERATASRVVDPPSSGGWRVKLGTGELIFVDPVETPGEPWEQWDPPGFEVIAHAALGVRGTMDPWG